jgi:hypothetical protein
MKFFSIFISILLLLIFLIFSGCNKNKAHDEYIPDQLKQYSVFQMGSYWVFKNESTGAIDSSYLLKPPVYLYDDPVNDPPQNLNETCEIYYGGTFLLSSWVSPDQYLVNFKNGYGGFCLYSNFKPGYTVGDYAGGLFKNLGFLDSLVINDQTFHQVMKTQYQSLTFDLDTITQTYYLAESVGIIRVQLRKNQIDTTWSLVRYHVVQ